MSNTMYSILEDNEYFLAVNKDAGVNFHNEEGEGLITRIKADLNIDVFPVHRLDKPTSGLILMAKSSEAASKLSSLFEEKEIEKYYIALSNKKPQKKMGKISGDMEKSRNKSWKLLRSTDNPAITKFKAFSLEDGIRFFLLRAITGKTHQLRVALKSVSSPILGDDIYGREEHASDRMYLHSFLMRFSLDGKLYNLSCLPNSGEYFTSDKFKEFIQDFKSPWEVV